MSVEFEDNSARVKIAMEKAIISTLHECAGEIKSQAQSNTRIDSGQTKGAWDYVIDENKYEAVIGNPLENAIWEEFGTGEYALNKDGRKGYWVYVKGNSSHSSSPKSYTLEEAKRVVAILKSKGLDAYYTKGKKPSRALYKAYTHSKNKIQKQLKKALGEI